MKVIKGVANSVFAAQDYCPMKTITFAHDNLFDSVQIYLNEQWEQGYVESIGAALRTFYLKPVLHWPGVFSPQQSENKTLLRLSRAFFGEKEGEPIVLHFDGSQDVSKTVAALNKVASRGFLPALENTVGVSAEKESRKYIERYVAALVKAERACAVIDIPRLWCVNNGPVKEALTRLAFIAGGLSSLTEPAILHLIDVKDEKQERGDWSALGEGIIPWEDVGDTLNAAGIKVAHAILEYEEAELASGSLPFLERWCAAHLE